MAYSTSNPPKLLIKTPDLDTPNVWFYASADVHTDVDAADYFADGQNLGMRVGDIVFVQETDNTYAMTTHAVSAIASGAATVGPAILV